MAILTTTALISFAVSAVASIAMGFIAKALRKKPKVDTDSLDFEQTVQRRLRNGQPLEIMVGRRIAAGVGVFDDAYGTKNEYGVSVTVLSAKPCTAFHKLFVDGEPVTLSGDPTAGEVDVTSHFLGKGDAPRVKIRIYLGDNNSTLGGYLSGKFPAKFNSSDNGGDYCVLITECRNTNDDFDEESGENYIPFQGYPEFKVELSGTKICDPRSGGIYANENTYVYSDNAALIDAQFDYGWYDGVEGLQSWFFTSGLEGWAPLNGASLVHNGGAQLTSLDGGDMMRYVFAPDPTGYAATSNRLEVDVEMISSTASVITIKAAFRTTTLGASAYVDAHQTISTGERKTLIFDFSAVPEWGDQLELIALRPFSDGVFLVRSVRILGDHNALIIGNGYPEGLMDIARISSNADYCDAEDFTCSGIIRSGASDQEEIWKCYNADRVEHPASIYSVPEGNRETSETIDLSAYPGVHISEYDEDGFSTEVYNEVQTVYAEPEEFYGEKDLPIYAKIEWIAADNHIPRQMSLPLLFVTDKVQAAKLQKQEIYISRSPATCTIADLPFGFIRIKVGDVITVIHASVAAINDRQWIVKGKGQSAKGDVSLMLRAYADAEAFAFNPATETPSPEITPPTPRPWPWWQPPGYIDGNIGRTRTQAIYGSYVGGMSGGITSTDDGSSVTIDVPAHTRVYNGVFANKSVSAAAISGLSYATTYYLYYDDASLAGGSITLGTATNAAEATTSGTYPNRHFLGTKTTLSQGGSDTGGTPPSPPGEGPWDGSGNIP